MTLREGAARPRLEVLLEAHGIPLGWEFDRHHHLPAAENQRESGVCRTEGEHETVQEHIWLVTFMHYDLGNFDDETCRLEPIENPFGPKLLPMSPE